MYYRFYSISVVCWWMGTCFTYETATDQTPIDFVLLSKASSKHSTKNYNFGEYLIVYFFSSCTERTTLVKTNVGTILALTHRFVFTAGYTLKDNSVRRIIPKYEDGSRLNNYSIQLLQISKQIISFSNTQIFSLTTDSFSLYLNSIQSFEDQNGTYEHRQLYAII